MPGVPVAVGIAGGVRLSKPDSFGRERAKFIAGQRGRSNRADDA